MLSAEVVENISVHIKLLQCSMNGLGCKSKYLAWQMFNEEPSGD